MVQDVRKSVSHFAFLGCDVSYECDDDKNKDIDQYRIICSTAQRTLGNKTRNINKIIFYAYERFRLGSTSQWAISYLVCNDSRGAM